MFVSTVVRAHGERTLVHIHNVDRHMLLDPLGHERRTNPFLAELRPSPSRRGPG